MQVEWLILADSAQVVGNKLYLMGGGWDRLTVNKEFPAEQRIGIALALKVPWNRTNERHEFEIDIASEDAAPIAKVGGTFEVGRPPGISPGQDQKIQLAVEANLKFTRPGSFVIVAKLDGKEGQRVPFHVMSGAGAPISAG